MYYIYVLTTTATIVRYDRTLPCRLLYMYIFLFTISLLSINNKLRLSRAYIHSLLADQTVQPYASVRPCDYVARFNRSKRKSSKIKDKTIIMVAT